MRKGVAAGGLLILLALGLAGHALAQEKSFTFPEVRIRATVLPDGSLELVERRTYRFRGGTFTVGTFGIDWPNGLIEDFAVEHEGNALGTSLFPDGDTGFFYGEWSFPRPLTGEQTFQISYRARCAVQVFTDRAHLYWQFVGTSGAPTDRVRIKVRLPGAAVDPPARPDGTCPPPPPSVDDAGETRPLEDGEVVAKAFGPAGGTFVLPNPQTVVLRVDGVPGDAFVEGSVLFPPESVPLGFAFERPITAEDLDHPPYPGQATGIVGWLAKSSNREALGWGLLIGIPVLGLILALVARIRDRVGDDVPRILTEPPEDIHPVQLAMLWGAARGQDFPSTVYGVQMLNLARTGVIELQPEGTVSNPSDFHVRRRQVPGEDRPEDRAFVDFLFGKDPKPDASSDGRVSLNGLRRKGSNKRLTKWSGAVKVRAKKARLTRMPKDSRRWERRLFFWTFLFGMAAMLILAISVGSALLINVGIWGAVLVGFPVAAAIPPRLPPEVRLRVERWRGYRRFLKKFSSLPDAPALAVLIWEQHLEYAVALDVAKRVLSQIRAVVPAERLAAAWPGGPSGLDGVLVAVHLNRISAIPPKAHSGSSGSSGGFSGFSSSGGGFSSGGGGGGGGSHAGAR